MGHALHSQGKKIAGVINILLMLAWPGIVWLSVTHKQYRWLVLLLACFFMLRLYCVKKQTGPLGYVAQLMAVLGAVLCFASAILQDHQLLMFYPVVVNGLLLALFGASLWSGMPVVERIARLTEPDLPSAAVVYTRTVTKVWCLFFVGNGSVALATCLYGDIALWTAWNGCISYVLMAMLMGGEWLVRQQVRKRT